MKVLERNNAHCPPKWEATCRCGRCESKLHVEESDLEHIGGVDQRDGRWDSIYFRCEVCSTYNRIGNLLKVSLSPIVMERVKQLRTDRCNTVKATELERVGEK